MLLLKDQMQDLSEIQMPCATIAFYVKDQILGRMIDVGELKPLKSTFSHSHANYAIILVALDVIRSSSQLPNLIVAEAFLEKLLHQLPNLMVEP